MEPKSDSSSAPPPEPLIPGLPDDVADQCLLHLPFPYISSLRSVSPSWNRALSSPAFIRSKSAVSLPCLFVFAFHRATLRLHWLAFDPRSHHWSPLPPMSLPSTTTSLLSPSAFACAAVPRRGELFVLGGGNALGDDPLPTFLSYRAATNSWSHLPPMPTPRSFFSAGSISGRVFVAGGGDGEGSFLSVDCYDPTSNQWSPASPMPRWLARYDAAVLGKRLFITEGWAWPFTSAPRGAVYDGERDEWAEMGRGMREGWTGVSAVVGGRLVVISECGEGRVKVYDEGRDEWRGAAGRAVPAEVRKPYAACGVEEGGEVFVVGSGMDVAVGTVVEEGSTCGGGRLRVEWEVVKGPPWLAALDPCSALVLFA